MKNNLVLKANQLLGKAKFGLKKHSPEILVVSGIVGTVVSTVMACKATTKLDDILVETREKMDLVHKGMDDGNVNGKEYSVEDGKKDTAIIYTQTAVKVAKLYAPSVALGVLSITSILAGNNILRKRNVALAAAYTAIDNSFKRYRENVIERFGEEVDNELRCGIKSKVITNTTVDENGNEKSETDTVQVTDPCAIDTFARIFDRQNSNCYDKDQNMNEYFLRAQEQYCNDLLIANGYLFINDVYDALGFPKTPEGQVVGWIYDEKNPVGSNCVDFRKKKINVDMGDGTFEPGWLLDFNHDGTILNMVESKMK